MDTIFQRTNSLIQQTHQLFRSLEHNNSQENVIEIEDRIHQNIIAINTNCDQLGIHVQKIPLLHREQSKMKFDQLKYDSKHLESALQSAKQRRYRKEQAANEREQLLQTRFNPNPATMVNLDFSVNQNNAMHRAHRGVDDMLLQGSNTLENLRTQRETIKGARKRILDMANTLGLSTHVMRMIEKRASQDKVILIGGVIVTLAVIGLVLIYWT